MYRAHALAPFPLLFILLYGPSSGIAQTTRTPTETEARSVLDKLVTEHMAADGVLGVGVVVVKDGQVWYERGYGFEDDQKTRRVDPERTEFFAASVSKLFVATAAMQLSEQGHLDLDHDINQYLDFHLGAFHDSRPITVADLLTHTAGVDDHMVGAESPIQQPVDLGAYFREHIPRLIRPPGFEIDYSNHGVALAARVVERVSGMTFYDYAEQNILRPLQMRHSSFWQPVPERLRSHLGSERFEKPYTILYPVATLVTTPSDMGKFMLAHLKAASDVHILTDAALDTMHAQHFALSPELPGVAYGFFEAQDAGGRGLFHAGARDHFSLLYLAPEQRFGIYIVMCGASEASQLPSQVVREFLRYLFGPRSFPNQARSNSPVPNWVQGRYRVDAISHSTLEKMVGLRAEIRVRASSNDIDVTIPSFSRGKSEERYFQVAPLLFRSSSGATMLFRKVPRLGEAKAFRSDFVSDPMSLTRIRWYETSTSFLISIVLSYVMFGGFLLLSAYWCGRKRYVTEMRRGWNIGVFLSLCAVAAPVTGMVMAILAREHQLYTIARILTVVMLIINSAIALAVAVIGLTPSVLVGKRWPIQRKIAFGALGIASLLFLRFAFYWHVWGWQF
jgi:CubicO group peptidase (beta-lactamase class C family)